MPKKGARSVASSAVGSASSVGVPPNEKKTKKNKSKPQVAVKCEYDSTEALLKGYCGYEGCNKRLMVVAVDDAAPISCEDHHDTWQTGYRYLIEINCQRDYNKDALFQDSFIGSHDALHKGTDVEHNQGKIDKNRSNYRECVRTYGAWDASAPLETILRLNPKSENAIVKSSS